MSMPSLRLITWNCRHGSFSRCLSELAEHSPDLIFLQECDPSESLPLMGQALVRRVAAGKGIALAAPDTQYRLTKLEARAEAGRATIAAAAAGAVSFTALGIWSQAPKYVDDVMRSVDAYADVLSHGPAVVLGDLNSGTALGTGRPPTKSHLRMVHALRDIGLVSAYHAFHGVEHGRETHPTRLHQWSRPWHIDFCFVPASWLDGLASVEVIADDRWSARSDHFPLRVDFRWPTSAGAPIQA